MDVRLPDGTVVQNVPDGISKADLVAKLQSNGMTVPQAWLTQATPSQSLFDQAARLGSQGLNYLSHPIDSSAGALDTAAHLGSAGIGGLAGGLSFLGRMALNGGNVDDAKQIQEATQNALTYQPRTKQGKAMSASIDKAMGVVPQALNKAGEYTADVTGSPLLGAAVNTGGNALLNLLPLKGAMRAADAVGDASLNASAMRATPGIPTTPAQRLQASLDAGKDVGYQVTPNYDPTATTLARLGNSVAGKSHAEQTARMQNQGVTNALAARSVGIDPAALIDPQGNLRAIRQQAYESGYAPIEQLDGPIRADADFLKNNAKIKQEHGSELSGNADVATAADLLNRASFDPAVILDHVQTLRSRASDAFAAGRADAGTAFKKQAAELESLVDRHLQDADGVPDGMLNRYRAARQLIAKTHTVQDALNRSTGNVDASKIADAFNSGTPLEGDLRTIADFANSAPKNASVPQGAPLPSSPMTLGLGVAASHATGGLSLPMFAAARAWAAHHLIQRNENPALLQPLDKTFGQSALDAIHGNAAAFSRIYGQGAPGAYASTQGAGN